MNLVNNLISLFNRKYTLLLLTVISYFFLVFFGNDSAMLPITFAYVLLIALLEVGVVFHSLWDKMNKYRRIIFGLFICSFIILNLTAMLFYNFQKKDNINKELASDFKELIPENSNVFGPISRY